MSSVWVPPQLNAPRKGQLLVVGRDPGEYEVALREPFVGPAGEMLDTVLSYGGFVRSIDVNIANLCGRRPPEDDFRKHQIADVMRGRRELDALIKRLQPKLIIALGNEAAYHLVPGWPTGGRDIFGAKGIEDRRGYFWETPSGWVLTMLHPAGALRKIVPGYELLCRDFRRAKRWLQGKLPREEFPPVHQLTLGDARRLTKHDAVGFDIETRWERPFCVGFCGDDLVPRVAKYGPGMAYAREILASETDGIAHNGAFDVDQLDKDGFPTWCYKQDTQTAWWALEPELAAQDEGEGGGKMTRKGLAFLASLDLAEDEMNLPYWKGEMYERHGVRGWLCGYPLKGDSDRVHADKLYLMGARDAYVTRRRWKSLKALLEREQVWEQYRVAFETIPACVTMARRGFRVDEKLRQERMEALAERRDRLKQLSVKAALSYIEEHALERFRWVKQCACCNGAGKRGNGCWRCSGLQKSPKKKEGYQGALLLFEGSEKPLRASAELLKSCKVADLKAGLLPCVTCRGQGETTGFDFNPMSRDQMMALVYDELQAPKWVFKGKDKMDDIAYQRILQWARGER